MVMMSDEQRTEDDVLAGHGHATGADEPGDPDQSVAAQPAEPSTDPAAMKRGGSARRGRLSFLAEMVVLFVVALTIALLIKTFVVQPFYIPSGSMENTLLIRDKVLVNKLVYDFRPVGRGDIVVFSGQGSWNPPASPHPHTGNPLARAYDATLGALFHSIAGLFGTVPGQTDYIKRVIGIPGDRVKCCNARGQITVNGVPLNERSYLISGAQPSHGRFNVVVPQGRIWVMGDNRPQSADSRLHDCAYSDPGVTCVPYDRDGTVPESKVIGRAFLIVWPPSRVRILPVPSTFTQPGLARAAGQPGSDPVGGGTIGVRQSGPYLPLAAGFAAATPLTLIRRRLRRRIRPRRHTARSIWLR